MSASAKYKTDECATKYPILMVHGMGFRDRRHLNYWGRIPKKLASRGARIYYGRQDSAGSIESNAKVVAESLLSALDHFGTEKVNIIAHSKGGLEARYIACTMGLADRIASITTINTPHNGSKTVDALMKLPKPLIAAAGGITNIWMRLLGDKAPDAGRAFLQFTTGYAEQFNRENPTPEGVLCRSYCFKMKHALSDITMTVPYLVVKHFDGENDGLLSEASVKWEGFGGVYTSAGGRGISHADEVDLRRHRFTRKPPANDHEISDIADFYIARVAELKAMGL